MHRFAQFLRDGWKLSAWCKTLIPAWRNLIEIILPNYFDVVWFGPAWLRTLNFHYRPQLDTSLPPPPSCKCLFCIPLSSRDGEWCHGFCLGDIIRCRITVKPTPVVSLMSAFTFIDRDHRNNLLRSTNESVLLPVALMCSMHIVTSWFTGTFPQNAGGPIYLLVCCLNSCRTGCCNPYVRTITISSSLTFASTSEPNVFTQLLL